MIAPFEFATAGRIVFGERTTETLGRECAKWGRRVLLVHGRNPERAERFRAAWTAEGLEVRTLACPGEPDVEAVVKGVEAALGFGAEVVVGLGGGSPMDLAKAVAALAANRGDPLDYLEVVGRGQPLTSPPLPCIAVPTTAGTGAEVTRNAVLSVPESRTKVSLRSPLMLPRLAVVDPTLTWGCPPEQTAFSGLDALTQLIEAFVCNAPNALTDALCRDGIGRAARALVPAWFDNAPEARSDMALAGLQGGLALANAKLGAVHGFAGPLGGYLGAPHGALCAALLPAVFEENARSVASQPPRPDLPGRFDEVGRLLTGSRDADAASAVEFLAALTKKLGVPPLAHWGLVPDDYPKLLPAARRAGSMQGNPVPLSDERLQAILERS